jgi:hypothetical protein
MSSGWEYLCTSNAHDAATLTRHMNRIASEGWELLTVTFAIKGESGTHDLFWRRPLDPEAPRTPA